MADSGEWVADDISVIRAVAAGRPDGVELLFSRYSDRILRFIYRRIGERREDAEELTQDTFLTAIRLAKTYRGEASGFVWLCGIANLRIIDHHRRRHRERRIPETKLSSLHGDDKMVQDSMNDGGTEEVVARIATKSTMETLMHGLLAEEREALLLRYVEGMTVREVGYLLGRSEKAVESLLVRAKRKSRERVQSWLAEQTEALR